MSDHGRTAATPDDARALAQLTRSVRARCPGVPDEAITERAHHVYQRYARAKVREFVPLLVERELVAEFRAARIPRIAP
ncbi:three-helix bundle dimerization domain-containing protein [Actinoplanes sp. NPDC049599]|uniref:three-helix bundle dimerization domain-containing protein n=1 Tax=Actinoplanes sp. NPDC049599 TaxID=3363903 RepID=UPI0037B0BD2B